MMLRLQVLLTADERRLLDTAAARTGRSIGALIREAVDVVYGTGRSVEADLAIMQSAFGAWADPHAADDDGGRDGVEWVEHLRTGSRLTP